MDFQAREKRARKAAETQGMRVRRSMKCLKPYSLESLPTSQARASWDKKLAFKSFLLDELEEFLGIESAQ